MKLLLILNNYNLITKKRKVIKDRDKKEIIDREEKKEGGVRSKE